MLRRLFVRDKDGGSAGEPLDYREQRRRVQDPKTKVRKELALRADTRPEILYFLAEDKEPAVRQAVAGNEAAPLQADVSLSGDGDDGVRVSLADKIGRLAPEMPDGEKQQIRDLTEQILETLARDELVKVRATLAERLKYAERVPPAVVRRLARDIETVVAAPVLECSPLLSDHELLEIIRVSRAEGALSAIAQRRGVSEPVCQSIAASGDRAAVTALLANQSAQIREETLDGLIERAPEIEAWHAPLVDRPALPADAIARIGRFVAGSLLRKLARRNDIDEKTARQLARTIEQHDDGMEPDAAGPVPEEAGRPALELHQEGLLNDETMTQAMAGHDQAFVHEGLALLSGIEPRRVERMMQLGNPKIVTALAWKAGLSMRTAMDLQKIGAKIAPPQILNARFGTEYPLTPTEMTDTLALL